MWRPEQQGGTKTEKKTLIYIVLIPTSYVFYCLADSLSIDAMLNESL